MAANLIHLRSVFKVNRCCIVLQNKLLNNKRHFADDKSKKANNLYETLGLPSSATRNEIKKAYYDLTLKYHPDKNENCEKAATKFREVTEAYEILGNYSLRKSYDRGIPITRVKNVPRPTVDHKVQYQEFFDRRTRSAEQTDARSQEIKDLGTYSKKEDTEKAEVEFRSSNSNVLQGIIAAFFIVLILSIRYS